MTRPLVLLAAASVILGHVSDLFTPAGGSVMAPRSAGARATLADGGAARRCDDMLAAQDIQDDYLAAARPCGRQRPAHPRPSTIPT